MMVNLSLANFELLKSFYIIEKFKRDQPFN